MASPTAEPRLRPLVGQERRLADALRRDVSAARLRADLEALPAPRHRPSDPRRVEAAERLVESWLRDAGWPARRRRFAGGTNVVALREGAEPEALLVVAHLDTVEGSIGADDNGSGVVALAELARLLAPMALRRSVVLAAVDLEEAGGFAGAEALIHELSAERQIVGAIVFDAIAFTDSRPDSQHIPAGLGLLYPGQLARAREQQMSGSWTLVVYRASSLPLARAFGEGLAEIAGSDVPILVRDPADLPLIGRVLRLAVPTVRHFARSDHVAFWRNAIPAIQVTDTADLRNPRYHTPFDLPATLDYRRLADTVAATAVAIARLAGTQPGRPKTG